MQGYIYVELQTIVEQTTVHYAERCWEQTHTMEMEP